MTKHFEKRRDELADYAAEHTNKDTEAVRHYTKWGFDACYAEMAPVIEALKEINRVELRSQRPGGGHSASATLSYEALKKIGVE